MTLRRLIVSVALLLAAAPLGVVAAPGAADAAACTPTITMGQPAMDAAGFVNFPVSFVLCDASRIAIKFRDRDAVPSSWGEGIVGAAAGAGQSSAGTCMPDGKAHRMVAYATVKTLTGGTILAQTPMVYFVTTPVQGDCTVHPSCTPSLAMDKSAQDSSGYMVFLAHYKGCEGSRIRIKWVDRDGINPPVSSSAGVSPYAAPSNSSAQIATGVCVPDGVAHRYYAYATMKTSDDKTIILQSDRIYVKSTPVTACGPWHRPAGAVNP